MKPCLLTTALLVLASWSTHAEELGLNVPPHILAGWLEKPDQETPSREADEETTGPPEERRHEEEVTTSPPPSAPHSTVSVLANLAHVVDRQLHHASRQWVNAALAGIVGLAMLVDASFVFKWAVLGAVFVLAMIVAMNEMSVVWALNENSPVRSVVGVEVGLLAAYAAHCGLEGVMVVVGALLGGLAARWTQKTLIESGVSALEINQWLVISFYTVFVLVFAAWIKRNKHTKFLASFLAAVGGALVSSAVSWTVTALWANGHAAWLQRLFPAARPVPGAWVDFLMLLAFPSTKDFGVFADSRYDLQVRGEKYRMDRLVGCSLWLILSGIGICWQMRVLKKRESSNSPARPGKAAQAREQCHPGKALLQVLLDQETREEEIRV